MPTVTTSLVIDPGKQWILLASLDQGGCILLNSVVKLDALEQFAP